MSYEGYSQFICKNGHYFTLDCSYADDNPECPNCFSKPIWENGVDQTNGCESTDDNPSDLSHTHEKVGDCICGYVSLELVEESRCDKCNSILEQTFKIPKKGGHRIK